MTIAVANIGSKAITFILGPLYSYFMTTEQYGQMDLITTTANLLLPFICLDIYDATFRYTSDPMYDKKKVFSSSMAVATAGSIVSAILLLLVAIFSNQGQYIIAVGIFSIIDTYTTVLCQFARGRGQMRIFAFSGVVNAIALLASNLVFLYFLRMELKGWLISFLIAKIVVLIYLILAVDMKNNLSIHAIDKDYLKKFLKFCIPLLPTATMWWIMNVSDRYVMAYYMGAAATGIYSVSNKFPNIMSSFENVFYQAWQTTAIDTLREKDRDAYYSQVLCNYIIVLSIAAMAAIALIKPMIYLLFEENYRSAWVCTPLLFLGVVFHAINGNLGSMYTVFKDTKGALVSTAIGAASNVALNFVFIPRWGLVGAAATTLLGYMLCFAYRWFDVRKFVKIRLDLKKLFWVMLFIPVQVVLFYLPGYWSYGVRIALTLALVVIYRDLFLAILKR